MKSNRLNEESIISGLIEWNSTEIEDVDDDTFVNASEQLFKESLWDAISEFFNS